MLDALQEYKFIFLQKKKWSNISFTLEKETEVQKWINLAYMKKREDERKREKHQDLKLGPTTLRACLCNMEEMRKHFQGNTNL